MAFSFTSLFSGAGGLDLGFIASGFKPKAAFDNDPIAVSAYRENIGKHALQLDLALHAEQAVEAASLSDLLLAGPPCQGFSTAGRNNPDDARNELLLQTVRIICAAKPRVAVVENVRGLLGAGFTKYTHELQHRLQAAGYQTTTTMINAADCGVAQKRLRVFIVASLVGPITLEFERSRPINLREALHGLSPHCANQDCFPDLGSRDLAISKAIRPGQKLSNVRSGERYVHTWSIPQVFGTTSEVERCVLQGLLVARRTQRVRSFGDADPVSASRLTRELGFRSAPVLRGLIEKGFVKRIGAKYDLTHSFNGKYRRLRWDEPAPTVDTRFGQPRYFLHPDEQRGFSIRETSRIQGFPDQYVFPDLQKDAYRLLGNAVPPPLAEVIARNIREAMSRQ